MQGSLISSVNLYRKVCIAAFGKEDQTLAVAKVPVAIGICIECEWRGHRSLDTNNCKYACDDPVKKNSAAAQQDATVNHDEQSEVRSGEESAADSDDDDEHVKGAIHQDASSVLMKMRYTARTVRLDLWCPTSCLASYDTKWGPCRDEPLHRCVRYIWFMLY